MSYTRVVVSHLNVCRQWQSLLLLELLSKALYGLWNRAAAYKSCMTLDILHVDLTQSYPRCA